MDLRPNVAVGHLLHWTDDLDGARVLYEQEYAQAMEQGVETGLPFVLWALAENEGWAGNWPRAEQLAAEGYRLAEDSGSPAAIAFMSVARGLLHAYRGRIDAGLRDAARAMELAGELGMPLLAAMAAQAFGIAALSTGDATGAHERLGPFADALSPSAWRNQPCAGSFPTRSKRSPGSANLARQRPCSARSRPGRPSWAGDGAMPPPAGAGGCCSRRRAISAAPKAHSMRRSRYTSGCRCRSNKHGRFLPPGRFTGGHGTSTRPWSSSRLRW